MTQHDSLTRRTLLRSGLGAAALAAQPLAALDRRQVSLTILRMLRSILAATCMSRIRGTAESRNSHPPARSSEYGARLEPHLVSSHIRWRFQSLPMARSWWPTPATTAYSSWTLQLPERSIGPIQRRRRQEVTRRPWLLHQRATARCDVFADLASWFNRTSGAIYS